MTRQDAFSQSNCLGTTSHAKWTMVTLDEEGPPDINLTMVSRSAGTSIQLIDELYAKRLIAEVHSAKLSALPFSSALRTRSPAT